MPVARGLMQMIRTNVLPTYIVIDSITPSLDNIYCNTGVVINFTVYLSTTNDPVTSGDYEIFNEESSTIIGEGSVNPSGQGTLTLYQTSGSYNIYIKYLGNQYYQLSQSQNIVFYPKKVFTATQISYPNIDSYYCRYQFFNIVAQVSPAVSDGLVRFKVLDTVTNNLIDLGTAPVSSGFAFKEMPANTITTNNIQKLLAFYEGNTCIMSSNNSGQLRLITPATNFSFSGSVTGELNPTIGYSYTYTYSISVLKTDPPSIFTSGLDVTFSYAPYDSGSDTYTPNTVVSSTDLVLSSSNETYNFYTAQTTITFNSTGYYRVYATYNGNDCYASSTNYLQISASSIIY